MHSETFEQVSIPKELIEEPLLLKEGTQVYIAFDADTETPLTCEFPPSVELEVVYTEPGLKGDTASATAMKPAKLETGLEIKVPLFINTGDIIKVDTRDISYIERVKKIGMKLSRPYTLQEIAQLLQLPYEGDPNTRILGISDVYHATHEDITFADNEKYYELANLSNVSVIIVQKGINYNTTKGIILTADAFYTYNQLVSLLFPFQLQHQLIHPEAVIGENCIIYPNVYIEKNVTIGNNCIIHPHTTIYGPCQIGNNVIIYSGAVVGSDAFYFKKQNDEHLKLKSVGNTIIEDEVEIGSNTTIDRG